MAERSRSAENAARRPRLLDLFCKAGGAAMGYSRAGFEVVGVDIEPQPNYPFEFVRADAMTFPLKGFDAIHASPPCQDHSALSGLQDEHGTGWMLSATIERLVAHGAPWVVENVVGPSVTMNGWWFVLCGSSFGIGVRRHRRFGSSLLMLAPSCRHDLQPEPIDVTGTGGPAARPEGQRGGIHRKPRNLAHAREVMGIDWMTRPELAQAIPPAYTEWIGHTLRAHIDADLVAAGVTRFDGIGGGAR